RTISVGWQQIVEIARAFSTDAKIIILDEPTSALTKNEIRILFEKIRLLRERGKTILFISHRLEEVFEIADQVLVLRDGGFVGRSECKAISRARLISMMVGKDISEAQGDLTPAQNAVALSLRSVTVRSRERTVLSGVGFELHRGEVLGLAGLMDSGRSELLRFLFGELESEYDGEIVFDSEVLVPRSAAESIGKRIFYLPGDRKVDGIFAGLDLVRNSTISVLSEFSRLGLLEKRKEAGAVAEMLSSLHVKMHSLAQPVETLSGGNQQKILLARGLMNDPALLLMEEPTRGIDVGAKEEIHALIAQLRAKGMSFIISSSDMPELLQVCDRVLVLYNGAPTAIVDARETTARELLHYAFNEETDEHDA
ncbi:MAG TPA: sugar ABC transporter ATP-binding protein, partial [Bacteroidota bacterium]|nr:sugar ABC transporter ATP-binding protein [Bacteroidota bacterium]